MRTIRCTIEFTRVRTKIETMSGSTPSFAVIGAGGIGGYFGARLTQAGYPLTFVARGPHLEAMRKNGLTVNDRGTRETIAVRAVEDAKESGPVDFVLVAVKLKDTQDAAEASRALIGDETAVVSLQNGVEAESQIASVVGAAHVMGGVAEMSAFIAEPGVVERVGPNSIVRFGELDGTMSDRARRLEAALSNAGVDCDLSGDITQAIWRKFILLTGLSALTALTRKPIGAVRDDPDTHAMHEQVMQEAFDVACAKGVDLPEDVVADRMAFVAQWPYDIRASMALDLERGKPLELPWLSGAVARLGRELGISTPANSFVYTALKLHVDGETDT